MTTRSGRNIQGISRYSPDDPRLSKRSKSVPKTPSSVGSSRSRSSPTPSRQSFSGTPSSGDDFDEDVCKLEKQHVLAVYRLYNDMRGELETIKAEQEQKNGQLVEQLNQWKKGFKTKFEERLMTLNEVEAQNDERLKTLEERLDKGIGDALKRCNDNASLESKLNRIRAFVAMIVIAVLFAVLFLIQANWTSLTCGFVDLVSQADPYIETLKSYAASVQDFVLSMIASARKIRPQMPFVIKE